MDRRHFLQRAVGAAVLYATRDVGDAVTFDLIVPARPRIAGPLHKPESALTHMIDTGGKAFTVVPDPMGSGRLVVRNDHYSGLSNAHTTMGSDDVLGLGSESACALMFAYDKPADLVQTGRNLFWQQQHADGTSPFHAISTLAGKLTWVYRDPTLLHRSTFGLIPWHHWMYLVMFNRAAKSGGFVEVWYAVDGWPDVNANPRFGKSNINTWQFDLGRNTIGQYAEHTKPGLYRGYWDRFGRAATPAAAIANAVKAA